MNPEGPHSGSITCPSSTTCYVVSGISEIEPDVAPVPGTVLNVSEDSGASWAEYRMPPGLGLTSPLACPTADDLDCVAGGTTGRARLPQYIRWRGALVGALPAGQGWEPDRAVGVSMTSCVGLFRLPVNPLSFGERVNASNVIDVGGTLEAQIASTTDGGRTWRSAHLPTGDVPQSVGCARGRCVVIAATPAQTVTGGVTRGAVFTSGDGGENWRSGKLPQGFGVVWSGPTQVDCVTFSTCWATGTVAVPLSGASSSSSLVSVAASSDDGGLTWRDRPLPADLAAPRLYSISCPGPHTAGWPVGRAPRPPPEAHSRASSSPPPMGVRVGARRACRSPRAPSWGRSLVPRRTSASGSEA